VISARPPKHCSASNARARAGLEVAVVTDDAQPPGSLDAGARICWPKQEYGNPPTTRPRLVHLRSAAGYELTPAIAST
jgi:hypothetical protein